MLDSARFPPLSPPNEAYRHLLEQFRQQRPDYEYALTERLATAAPAQRQPTSSFSMAELFFLDYCVKRQHLNAPWLDDGYYERLQQHVPIPWLRAMIYDQV